jgi:hypothetical protein
MRLMIGLVVASALGAAACKKKPNTAEPSVGSGSAVVQAPIDAAAGPWTLPTGASAADANADATSLGAQVTLHLVERVSKDEVGGGRGVKTIVVLEGSGGAIAADETSEGLAQDGAPATMAMKAPADIVLAPLTPSRPIKEDESIAELDYKGPLLFLVHFESKGETRDVALAKDKDTLAVWTMIAPSDAVDVAPAWEESGRIKLAPGATVTTPAITGAAAVPTASPTGTLSPTALDDALAAKGVQHDAIAKRASGPHSQWAVVNGKMAGVNPATYVVWRTTAAGTSTVELAPPPAPPNASYFDEVTGIDVQDVDKDGVDDAVITAKWERQLSQPASKGHTLDTTERVEQLYVVGGANLALGAQHVRSYTTETNLGPDENAQEGESVTFDTAVVPGTPPVLRATVGESSVQSKRVKGLLDPAKDPLLKAGDTPIVFK